MNTLFEKLDKIASRKEFLKEELLEWEKKREKNLYLLNELEEARVIFQTAAQITQTQLAERIEKIVSSALAAVFPDPYTFKIEFVKKRNSTECNLLFEKNGKTRSPLSACGFGAADIASLALRVAYWKLDENARNCLILDEPLRNLSLDKQPLASQMIHELSKMPGGLQFIIVTHNVALMGSADKCFKVSQIDGVSTLEEVENNV
jgi:DNA repair exonuclease SbcCD ATPase subunit